MPFLDEWNERIRIIANIYRTKIIHPDIIHPKEMEWGKHVYHLYVIQVRERDKFQNFLSEHGIGTMIHYPVPVHLQESLQNLGYQQKDFPMTGTSCTENYIASHISGINRDEVNYVCDIVNNYTSVYVSIPLTTILGTHISCLNLEETLALMSSTIVNSEKNDFVLHR